MSTNAWTVGASGAQASVDTSGNLTTAGGMTASGAMTTTDGVTSGTARKIGGLADVAVAAGTPHTNSTDEAVLDSYSIPANTLKAGTVMRIQALVRVTDNNSTDTLTCRLRLGPTTLTGTALLTTAAVDSADADVWVLDYTFVARAAPGATASCVGHGFDAGPDTIGTASLSTFMAPTNFATNGILFLELTADWSVAHAENIVQSESLVVTIMG